MLRSTPSHFDDPRKKRCPESAILVAMESRDLSALWMLPAGPPPPGVKSNFVNPPSLAMPIVIVNAVSLALMMVAVTARFIAKSRYSQQRWDLSDGEHHVGPKK